MPRYMVERSFPDGLNIPVNADGAQACGGVIERNAGEGVSWVHSYVSADKTKTFCVYEGPSEEAVRQAAQRNEIPVDRVVEIPVDLTPH